MQQFTAEKVCEALGFSMFLQEYDLKGDKANMKNVIFVNLFFELYF